MGIGLSQYLGVDIGTGNTVIYSPSKGIVVDEPSVVALDQTKGQIVAVGWQAKQMVGKLPGDISAIYPIKNGIISDFQVAAVMMKYFIKKAVANCGMFIGAPRIIISVPSGLTEMEKRALEDVGKMAGGKNVLLANSLIAGAMGMGEDIFDTKGIMIVDVGAGRCEAGVLALGGAVSEAAETVGGNNMDRAIVERVKKTYGLLIGSATAAFLKKQLNGQADQLEVTGRCMTSGLPKSVVIRMCELERALTPIFKQISQVITETLEKTPPELMYDICEEGMRLIGGCAQVKGLKEYLESELNLKVVIPKECQGLAAIGAGNLYSRTKKGKSSETGDNLLEAQNA